MIPSLVPSEIVDLHRTLLAALRVDYFPPGMLEMNNWRDFLFVMAPLANSEGGAFGKDDIARAVALMRHQNSAERSNWSLRFIKIMRDPESFRDIVLIARKASRKRPPVEQGSRTDATGAQVAVERDPAAENPPQPVSAEVQRFMKDMDDRKARRAK